MSADTSMPRGITRGYGTAFLDMLSAVPRPKILSIQELKDLDDADLKAVHEAQNPVKSRDEAA